MFFFLRARQELTAGTLLTMAYAFDYDLTILAIPFAWIARDYLAAHIIFLSDTPFVQHYGCQDRYHGNRSPLPKLRALFRQTVSLSDKMFAVIPEQTIRLTHESARPSDHFLWR